MKSKKLLRIPLKTGLYDPAYEKDSCGVGMVANIKGIPSRQIMEDAYIINSRMDHRGGCGFEVNTGDGAGILVALPDTFLKKISKEMGIKLPEKGSYSVGNIFLPQDRKEREFCKNVIQNTITAEGQNLLGWRPVPIDPKKADVGPAAKLSQPVIEQLFIASSGGINQEKFERKLYLIRKQFSHKLRTDKKLTQANLLFACSLSSKVIVYKGMLTPLQLYPFFPDLEDKDFETHLAMVHSRFSTNTFPSWDRAQPNRYMCHNGEINTLKGNVNLISARQGVAQSDLFEEKLKDLFPIAEPDSSDSGNFDNILEFLMLTGRSLQESIMMMIPEAWQSNFTMNQDKRAFYEYSSSLMEPWDGPASIVFTDGKYIGAVLDRNGLRPSRYYVTKDDKVIMASEVGVLPVDPENVLMKGRLQPGKMFLIDFEEGRMVPDEEIKEKIYKANPYQEWNKKQIVAIEEIVPNKESKPKITDDLISRMQAFGYTVETMQFMLLPIVRELRDPLGSMGNDAALACLSDKPRLIFDYFKQLFAQVTNPAIDSIREEVIMSLECLIGPEGNLLSQLPENAHRLRVKNPIISDAELENLQNIDSHSWRTKTLDITYEKDKGDKKDMLLALDRICQESEEAIEQGFSFIILSDKQLGPKRIAISSLLACSSVHHHLIRKEKRTRIGIIVETGEAREVHHHCLLIGYGADVINPYLAFESLWQARQDGLLDQISFGEMVKAYKKGVAKGILKVMAKMGISTLQSYKGAQIFEAVGLADEIIEKCFPGTASRVQGVNFDILVNEMERRHELDFQKLTSTMSKCFQILEIFIGGKAAILTCGIQKLSPTCRKPPEKIMKIHTGNLLTMLINKPQKIVL